MERNKRAVDLSIVGKPELNLSGERPRCLPGSVGWSMRRLTGLNRKKTKKKTCERVSEEGWGGGGGGGGRGRPMKNWAKRKGKILKKNKKTKEGKGREEMVPV